jgi:hypothetical protein
MAERAVCSMYVVGRVRRRPKHYSWPHQPPTHACFTTAFKGIRVRDAANNVLEALALLVALEAPSDGNHRSRHSRRTALIQSALLVQCRCWLHPPCNLLLVLRHVIPVFTMRTSVMGMDDRSAMGQPGLTHTEILRLCFWLN